MIIIIIVIAFYSGMHFYYIQMDVMKILFENKLEINIFFIISFIYTFDLNHPAFGQLTSGVSGLKKNQSEPFNLFGSC